MWQNFLIGSNSILTSFHCSDHYRSTYLVVYGIIILSTICISQEPMLIRDIRLQYIGDIWDVKVLHQMFLVLIFPKIVFILVTLPGKIQKKK